jgi:hypothetical protein
VTHTFTWASPRGLERSDLHGCRAARAAPLLVEPQQLALQRLIDAVISYWGAIATIALLTIFTPAIIAWWLDVEAYRGGLKDQTKELGDDTATDELEFGCLISLPFPDVLGSAPGPPTWASRPVGSRFCSAADITMC